MFAQLSEKISGVISKLRNSGKITEKNIEEALREVRLALLEADVHVSVVRDLLARIKTRALGQDVIGSLSAGQQFLKIVQDELIETLGGSPKTLIFEGEGPHPIMMIGLQGSGKTTSSAKLALFYKRKGRRPYLVPADFQRPAAIEQLKILAKQIDVPAHDTQVAQGAEATVRQAMKEASEKFCDIVIIDTAGRLHIDEPMMNELRQLKKLLGNPQQLFVADAMTGQEAVNVAKAFHEALGITGIVLTKMDGDARGGAALSVQQVAQCPIYFTGLGEKLSELESFHPDRLVSRLLDRGDIMSLIERAEEVIDQQSAEDFGDRLKKKQFDLEDFRSQLKQMKKLGSMGSLLGFLPGAKKLMQNVDMNKAEVELKRKEAIINSMTVQERRKPQLLNASRRVRIANGSGTTVAEINRFMKEFDQMRQMMLKMGQGPAALGAMKNLFK